MTPPAPSAMSGRARVRAALLLIAVPALLMLAAPAAGAHPLGNFTVNRYDGLTVRHDRVDDLAVVDTAEIPTLQAGPAMDTDHDGRLSPAEAAAHARTACAVLAGGISATASPDRTGTARPRAVRFRPVTSAFRLVPGQAGLDTGRLECRLTAAADLGEDGTLRLTSGVDQTRIGWHEITARGDGVRIGSSDVPAVSVSDALRRYPADLLSSPLDVRTARLTLGAGPGSATATAPSAGWPADWYAALDRHLGALTDRHRLTFPVGLLAVLMAIVLGAGHAALPGHGKTIMAAYLAGRRGRPRDAVTVATTVTLTHTASVLVLGIALSVSSALVGEDVLAWLGTASGLVIAAAGVWLLPNALRGLRTVAAGVAASPAGHHHGHGHDHHHPPVRTGSGVRPQPAAAAKDGSAVAVGIALAEPEHRHGQEHEHEHSHQHGHDHRHGLFDRHHHHHGTGDSGRRKSGLIGIGVAGGLVPSPSALVVLLGSIALGRTAFGVTLVVCYGLGMAATLAAAGLLLLTLRDRVPALNGGRVNRLTAWGARFVPLGTAVLILAVGLGTAVRALPR
ncbi:nickel transporter [Streptomyces polygonati]|uniref:Nickel transporter n=1 Tax=Streptomyces polygonati TaxID=1617087 RepID=A0ABV8HJF1_9ACTN